MQEKWQWNYPNRNTIFMLKYLSLTLLLCAACAPPEMTPRADQDQANPGNTNGSNPDDGATTGDPTVSEGAQLYVMYCQTCHGPDAAGGAVWPASIQGIDPIADIVTHGRGSMAPVPIDTAKIAAIQVYLNSFNAPDPTTMDGEALYASECAACHGPDGSGTALGPTIQFPVPGYAEYVTRNGRSGLGFPGAMAAYTTDQVSDVQFDEIVAFLHNQTRPTTGEGLYTTFCANCHGDDGRGGVVGKSVVGEESYEDIREGNGGNNYGARLVYMPRWSATELTDDEISLIDAYIEGL